jgi:predicted ATP-grasp superfamily ATP-dependent carboligase
VVERPEVTPELRQRLLDVLQEIDDARDHCASIGHIGHCECDFNADVQQVLLDMAVELWTAEELGL